MRSAKFVTSKAPRLSTSEMTLKWKAQLQTPVCPFAYIRSSETEKSKPQVNLLHFDAFLSGKTCSNHPPQTYNTFTQLILPCHIHLTGDELGWLLEI